MNSINQPATANPDARQEKLLVLLVEDNPGDADLVRELLDQPGRTTYRVVHVENLQQAVAVLGEMPAAVVLLDLRLPDGSGVDCVRALREVADQVPVVVLTGADDDELAFACVEAGAQDYLVKNELRGITLRRSIGYAISRRRERQLLAESEERKRRLEQQLLQAQKIEAIGQLAGGVAHDFNNLLSVIFGYCELLIGELPPGSRAAARIEQIVEAAERAAALTHQLLAFGRKQVLQPIVFDLGVVVAEIARMLRRLIGENIELAIRSSPSSGRVLADKGQIEQVIVNLTVNGRDAMPNGGRLVLETADATLDEAYTRERPGVEPGEYVVLAVSDEGCGMSTATLAQIFEPFFTTKEPGKGTGLGLSTVYGIVKQSGGHIAVYSELGHGTTFKVYLPRVDDEAEKAAPAPVESARLATETILLLEDSEPLRQILREVLEDAGYSVLDGSTLEEALAHCQEHPGPIHLVLSDVVMPRHNGPEIVAWLKALRPELRVVFMSGYTAEAIGNHGVLERGTHYLQKPITSKALRAKLREVLDGPG